MSSYSPEACQVTVSVCPVSIWSMAAFSDAHTPHAEPPPVPGRAAPRAGANRLSFRRERRLLDRLVVGTLGRVLRVHPRLEPFLGLTTVGPLGLVLGQLPRLVGVGRVDAGLVCFAHGPQGRSGMTKGPTP